MCDRTAAYHQGISLMGIKNPLVNPATADSMGDKRRDFCGKVRMSQMSRAVQVWFRAMLTKAIWTNSSAFQRVDSTSCTMILLIMVCVVRLRITYQNIEDSGTDEDGEEGI